MTFCTADDEIITPYNITKRDISLKLFHNLKILPIFTTLSSVKECFCSFYTPSHVTDQLPFNLMKRKMFLSLLVFSSLNFSAFSCHPPEIVNTLKIYHFNKHLICFINGNVEKICVYDICKILHHIFIYILRRTATVLEFRLEVWRTEYPKTRNLQIHSIIQLFIYMRGWFCIRYGIEVIKVKECKNHNLVHFLDFTFLYSS